MLYWFYILKEVANTNGYSNTDNIVMDVFIADDRAAAKKHLTELYTELPFRKPKNAAVGTRYLYLTDSTAHWYEYHHGTFTVHCSNCASEFTVHGEKNIIKNHKGQYCSDDCKETYMQMLSDNSDWINEEDHVGLGTYDKTQVIGYIYKITNKVTMKSYVGQTVNPALFRWWQHLKVDKKFEQVDITELVFEVIEIVDFNPKTDGIYSDAKDKLNKREAYYIRLYNCVEEGYNAVQPKEFEHDLFTIGAVEAL